MKVLIIEDEVLAQEELMRILSRHFPEMKIVAVLESVKEAIAWFETNVADLVLWMCSWLTVFVLIYLIMLRCRAPLYLPQHTTNMLSVPLK